MSPTTLIFLISAGIIGFGVYYLFLSSNATIKDKIKSIPQKKIGEVKDGDVVSIVGNVVLAGRTLTAPLSKRKCAYYRIKVRRGHDDHSFNMDYSQYDEEKGGDLLIYDGEHYALIDTKLIAAQLNQDEDYRYEPWNFDIINFPMKSTPELGKYLEKRGKPKSASSDLLIDVHASEGVLEEGECIAAAGKASWRKSADLKLDIPNQKILYLQALNEYGVYVTEDLF